MCPPLEIGVKRAIYHDARVGSLSIDYREDAIVALRLCPNQMSGDGGERGDLSDMAFCQICEYLAGERRAFSVPIDVSSLTPFQQRTLRELQKIPYGECRSYKEVAEALGSPRAARAIGSACNRNPIHIIIPCHRVVGSSGELRGYASGVETKRALLEIERGAKGAV